MCLLGLLRSSYGGFAACLNVTKAHMGAAMSYTGPRTDTIEDAIANAVPTTMQK